jgi:hypothetical protein
MHHRRIWVQEEKRRIPMGKNREENVYQRLGKKINGLTVRTPWNETFHSQENPHERYIQVVISGLHEDRGRIAGQGVDNEAVNQTRRFYHPEKPVWIRTNRRVPKPSPAG